MVTNALSVATLQSYMDASPFIRSTGMRVAEANADGALSWREAREESPVVTIPLKPEFERAANSGQFHGGPIAALIDTAGCFALVMALGHSVPTINFRTDYLRPAVNTSLRAVARVRRAGRTVGVVDVDVFDDSGKLFLLFRGRCGVARLAVSRDK